jgi:hypothetical protein
MINTIESGVLTHGSICFFYFEMYATYILRVGRFPGVKICRRAPGVSHLLFADDTLLFFKAESGQAERVKHVIEMYASSTGQLINPSKCSVRFSSLCPEAMQDSIRDILEIQREF